MFWKIIYKLLWHLLNFLASIVEAVFWLRLRIIAFALWSYDLCQSQEKRKHNELEYLRHCKQHLLKVPKHLAVIIGPRSHQVDETFMARIFSYALCMNIECISYYDTREENARSKTHRIRLEKLKCPEGWRAQKLDKRRALWQSDSNISAKNGTNGVSNGCIPSPLANGNTKLANGHVQDSKSLKIHEISADDNHRLIAQVCRDLFRERQSPEMQQVLKSRQQLTQCINAKLSQYLGDLSEPELCIVFDDFYCTYGMLPWHLRFTEFYYHETARRFDVKSFARIFYRYSRCEQRWGK